jgi:tetratricopeptide (TPR) repeat protein
MSSETSSPNAQAIDVSEMTSSIEKAQKEYKAKPDDAKAKQALAAAYFERAFALTKAAQYRPALGDFRKGLKLNPDDKEAKEMHDQIISIFESMGRTPPKEGEEPAPLPFKKQ